MRRALLCLPLLAAPAAAQPRPGPPAARRAAITLDAVLARFRALTGLSARFREEKRIALLAAPLVSEGTLDYAPPGRMVRRTTSPAPSVALIDGARLRFRDEGGEQTLDMAAMPVVRQFVDSFLAVVAGDRAALERAYAIDFRAPDPAATERWSLTLTPRAPALQRVFREIALEGEGVALRSLTLRETNGDASVTTFSDVNTARVFAPDEAARVFRVAP
jgi:outer membrane lipoprotein-sorting protein